MGVCALKQMEAFGTSIEGVSLFLLGVQVLKTLNRRLSSYVNKVCKIYITRYLALKVVGVGKYGRQASLT